MPSLPGKAALALAPYPFLYIRPQHRSRCFTLTESMRVAENDGARASCTRPYKTTFKKIKYLRIKIALYKLYRTEVPTHLS